MKRIPYTTQEEWHELRSHYVGGSEIACLFHAFQLPDGSVTYRHMFAEEPKGSVFLGSVSPYKSGVRLWHEKNGNLEPQQFDNPRTQAGRHIEPAIASWMQERTGWDIRKVTDYIVHDSVRGMAASLDYEILDHPLGHAAMDCKEVRFDVWRNQWEDGEHAEPPLHIILQLHHQMACAELPHSVAGVYEAGNDLHILDVPRMELIIGSCEEAVNAFWWAVDKDRAPDMRYDMSVARDLFARGDDCITLDFVDDDDFAELVFYCEYHKDRCHEHRVQREQLHNRILSVIRDATIVQLADGRTLYAPTRTRRGVDGNITHYRSLTVK
jgi:predicted phage-related endonuclease